MMILRRIFAALAVLCLVGSPAYAQKSKSTLSTELSTNWPDNSTGAITPAILRSTVLDIINSYVDWLTCTGSGGVVYWASGTPTCLAAGSNGQILSLSGGIPAWSSLGTSNLIAGAGITITGTISPTISITNTITPVTVGNAAAIPQLVINAQGEITSTATLSPNVSVGNITTVLSSSIVGNNTPATANATSLTPGQVGAMLCTPVRTVQISGSSATYTTPTCNTVLPSWLEVDLQGGGGGGGGSGTTNTGGTAGNASSFGALTANGGSQGAASSTVGGAGGTCSGSLGTQQNFPGSAGASAPTTTANSFPGGAGGVSYYGGYGAPGTTNTAGGAAPTNSGGGGVGGSGNGTASVSTAPGGGAGCHIRTVILSPVAASYTFTVGGTASGANAGTSGQAGGQGAAGLLDIIAHWQ